MTERDGIVRYIRRRGHEDLAREIEQYADRALSEPSISAEEWMKTPNVGH